MFHLGTSYFVMHELDLKTLRLFKAVAEAGSMTGAARQEAIVSSAISKRLSALEDSFGVRLLIRRKHGVELTPAGTTLLQHASTLFSEIEKMKRDLSDYTKGTRGHVRIVATQSALAEFLPEEMSTFLNNPAHEGIRVDVEENISAEVLRKVHHTSGLLGICWDAIDLTELVHYPWQEDNLCVVTPAEHPLASHKSLRLTQTLDYEFVGLPPATAVQSMLRREAAISGRYIKYRSEVAYFNAALHFVAARLAIAILPDKVAQPYEQAMGLRVIPLNETWAKRRFVVCYRGDQLQPAAQLFVNHLIGRHREYNNSAESLGSQVRMHEARAQPTLPTHIQPLI